MKSPTPQPPEWALRFLQWFCPPSLYEGIEGDLIEQYELDCRHSSNSRWTRVRFGLHVLKFFRPEIIFRNQFALQLINTIMISNYLKVASRNIMKRKMFSFINAFGLSIGIAFCTLIYLYIKDEKSFDQFHANKNLIYRMEGKSYDTWQQDPAKPYQTDAWLQSRMRDAIKEDLAEVEYATRFNPNSTAIFRYGDKVFTEKITYVDADFFKMFSFPLLKGNAQKIFNDKSEVVLTPAIAQKYFGDEDPIGKTIVLDDEGEKSLTVTGLIESPPAYSSLDFAILVPQPNRPYYDRAMAQWGNFNTPTFVQLRDGTNLENFQANLDRLVKARMGEDMERWKKRSTSPIPDSVKIFQLVFTPLADIHLKKEIGWTKVSDAKYSYILGGIAIAIMLIAAINYISLALTTSASRKTEVGVRKVVGAHKKQLIYQFGFESILMALISMVIGIGLVILFLPSFNDYTRKAITLDLLSMTEVVSVSLLISIVIGCVAGSYPSMFLSRFNPAAVLKGGFTSRVRAGFTRPLVVIQFVFSAGLIISSIIMYRQMRFITTKDLGFDKEQILVIPTQTGWNEEADKTVARFRARLQSEPSVISVAGTTSSFNQGYSRYGYTINDEQKSAYVYGIDPEYIPTMGMELVMGRNFDPAIASDTNAVIINQALAADMNWEDPLQEHLNWQEDTVGLGAKVIGVVKDYHFLSLESKIEPLFLSMDRRNVGFLVNMLVKVKPGDVPQTIERIKSAWREVSPDKPFDFTFLDEDVARQYESHKRWMGIMGLSTGFAILISCLGLFGLSGINAINRTKEIGIRKVMGANLGSIFVLLNKEYVWLALIAFTIATPLSWYVMSKWLADFKFAVEISWELFAISMGAGLILAIVTVSYHAFKAATINPAQTLKYE